GHAAGTDRVGAVVVGAAPYPAWVRAHALGHVVGQEGDLGTQVSHMVGPGGHHHQPGEADQADAEDQHGNQHLDQRDPALARLVWHGTPWPFCPYCTGRYWPDGRAGATSGSNSPTNGSRGSSGIRPGPWEPCKPCKPSLSAPSFPLSRE